MLLSDMGADVLSIVKPGGTEWPNPVLERGRHAIELDILGEEAHAVVFDAVEHADVVVEGYRPGVMERLGYGPDWYQAARTCATILAHAGTYRGERRRHRAVETLARSARLEIR